MEGFSLALCLLSDTSEMGGREGRREAGGSQGIQRYNRPAELQGEGLTFVPLAAMGAGPVFMLIAHSALCRPFFFLKTWPLDAFFDTVQLAHTQHCQQFSSCPGLLDVAVHTIHKRGFRIQTSFFSFCLESSMDLLGSSLKRRERNIGACSLLCALLLILIKLVDSARGIMTLSPLKTMTHSIISAFLFYFFLLDFFPAGFPSKALGHPIPCTSSSGLANPKPSLVRPEVEWPNAFQGPVVGHPHAGG